MGARRIRREQRQYDQKMSRRLNGMRKTKERIRRDERMVELIRKGKFPYTPGIMSWVSRQLDKPTSKIEPGEVEQLVASKSAG